MIKKLAKCIRENKKDSILTIIITIFEVAFEVAIPFLMAYLLSEGVEKSDMAAIGKYGGLLVGCALAAVVLGFLGAKFSAKAATGFAKNVRTDTFNKTQDFAFANIEKFSTSGILARLTTDTNNLQTAYFFSIRVLVRAPLMLIFATIAAIIIQPFMGIIYAIVIPLMTVVFLITFKKAHPKFYTGYEMYDGLNKVVQENVRGMRVVKSFCRQDYEKDKIKDTSLVIRESFTKAHKYVSFNAPFMQLCIYATVLFIGWFGSNLIVQGSMSSGEIISLLTYSVQILQALNLLSLAIIMIVIAYPGARRIVELLEEEPTIKNPIAPILKLENGDIEFSDVKFSYLDDENKLALKDITLKINSGEVVGIIGGTASSKSSLVSLIPRLYDTMSGNVKVSGIDVKEYDLKVLRDNVAMVLQKNVLFFGTIKDNLRWGNENATDEEIINACKVSNAHEFVSQFPDGYDTIIEQGGTNVSGGQKQRLCIARALLKNPKILILDDSTSAVDTKTESSIFNQLKNTLPSVTKLIISQRISSVEKADKIIVLDNGQISSIGTHEELLNSNEIYKEVYSSQVKGRS